jgi:hypothetical protein
VTMVVVLLTVAVAILAVLVVGLLRAYGAVLRHLHDLGAGLETEIDPGAPPLRTFAPAASPGGAGSTAADITGVTPDGAAVALRVVGTEHDTVLAFLSTGCTTCQPFWEGLAAPGGVPLPAGARLVVVTQGPETELPAEVARLAPPGTSVVMSSEAWREHEVPGSPYVALVEGASGRIRGSGTGASWDQVAGLLHVAEGDPTGPDLPAAPGRPRAAADLRRERELDAVLLSAGIEPGDPSLYPPTNGRAP